LSVKSRSEPLQNQFDRVLSQRTRYITVVTEDLYQAHNGAAVARACDGFGIQDIYAISNRNNFNLCEKVAEGADRWVDVFHYNQEGLNNTEVCLTHLKQKGYRVLATTLRDSCMDIEEVPLDRPIALCFGTELKGLSNCAHEMADGFVRLPMYGFTQSFNISVSTALSLCSLTSRLRSSQLSWPLSLEEQSEIKLRWQARGEIS